MLSLQYNWLTRDDRKRMLGWLACALACKCMKHRPHVWFSGYPGKAWFMNRMQHALHRRHYRFHASPIRCRARSGQLHPQVIDRIGRENDRFAKLANVNRV